MKILLCNDDGIDAPGLAALRAEVADLGELTIIAPDGPRSATGHSITLHRPLIVKRGRFGEEVKFHGISVDGNPADCIRLAFRCLLEEPPDLVLSGLNAGSNVGINVFYSGTVAAAAEAAMFGIPAVAMSAVVAGGKLDLPGAARHCRCVIERLLAHGIEAGELLNVNIPELQPGWPRGIRIARQCTGGVKDAYLPHKHSDGHEAYQIADEYAYLPSGGLTDVSALMEGYITVTPLRVDMTAHEKLETLNGRDWSDIADTTR